tara:strand:+ start:91 stop:858 length:768 start_codon:yes stop_codon:yes gene_type:complete
MAQAYGENERLEWERNNPVPVWHRAGVSESQWNAMGADAKWMALEHASQDQGIHRTGDEALLFTWGPLLANLFRAGVSRTISTPPPKPGHVRLWRGEGKPVPETPGYPLPRHLKGVQKRTKPWNVRDQPRVVKDAKGRWYHKDKKVADEYAGPNYNQTSAGGQVRYVDVRRPVANKYLVSNQPKKLPPRGKGLFSKDMPHNPAAHSKDLKGEFYFPPEADAILQSSRLYRPPLAPFRRSIAAPALMDSMILREGE